MVLVILRGAPQRTGLQSIGLPGVKLWAAMMILVLAAGCSHPAMQSDPGVRGSNHTVPFHDPGQGASTAPSDSTVSDKSGLPFQDVESLPVGTLLTVRLNNFVSADHPGPSNTFEAILDEPIKIDGNVVVPRGSTVSGHVESAQVSDVNKNRGYIRLDLQSIDIGGRELPVQTSSLFTHGSAHLLLAEGGKTSTNVLTLEKGRRLIFRLTEPVYVAAQHAVPVQ
jgi:hypothetical protein